MKARRLVLKSVTAVAAAAALVTAGLASGGGAARVASHPERLGGPEGFADMAASSGELAARSAAPFSSVAPGAYQAGLAQAASIPAAGSQPGSGAAWRIYGHSPECGGRSSQSTVCPPPSSRNGYYTQLGPLGFVTLSGRVTSFAGDPTRTGRLWASPTAGGVFESDNGGASWFSVGDRLPTQVVGAIAYDAPLHELIVGSGDNSFGGDGISGHGVFLSRNDGASWTVAKGIPDLALSFRVVVSPVDRTGRTVYLASSKGLYRSTNAGYSWVNERLPTTPPGYAPNCAGNTTTKVCFFASIVTDVVVKATSTTHAPAGAVLAVVGWRAGKRADTNADGSTNTSCRLNGQPTPCLQAPRNGLYVSSTGAPGSFAFQDQGNNQPTRQGFAPNPVVGRTALGIANGPGQNSDAVYALVEDATKFQGCPDVLDVTQTSACQADVNAEGNATYLDGMYASYDFGRSWTKIMDYSQTKYAGTNSSLVGVPGYSPGIQSWYNLWVQPDPYVKDERGNPTRVLFGLEEVWENNLTVPGVLTDPWQLHQTPVPGLAPWHVIGRYWNACSELAGQPCNTDLKANPIPGTTTHPDQHAVLFVEDRSGGETLYVGSDGGVFKQHVVSGQDYSNDAWGDGANVGLTSLQPYDAEMSKDGTVVSGLQDNGELKINPNGSMAEIFGGDGFMTTIDPNHSNNIMEEYTYGSVSMTQDGGATWFPQETPSGCSGATPVSPPNALFSTPLEQDPTMPGHIVEGCNQVEEVVNGYANPCQAPAGAPASQCQAFNINFNPVFSLGNAPSGAPYIPSAVGVRGANIYVGFCGYCDVVTGGLPFRSGIATNVGGLLRPKIGTSNGWHFVHPVCHRCGVPGGGLPQRYITSIQMDPRNPRVVYLTLGGYGRRWIPPGALGDSTRLVGVGHLFVSHDAGRTFTNVSGNLPDVPANWTLVRGGSLIVTTDLGVYISPLSALGHFSVLGKGLPRVPVFTVRADPGNSQIILISTYGRGDWTYRFPVIHRRAAVAAPRVATSTATTQNDSDGDRDGDLTPGSTRGSASATATAVPSASFATRAAEIGGGISAVALIVPIGLLMFRRRRRRMS